MAKKKSTKVDEKKLAEFNENRERYVSKEALQEAMDIVDSQDPLTEEQKRQIFGDELVEAELKELADKPVELAKLKEGIPDLTAFNERLVKQVEEKIRGGNANKVVVDDVQVIPADSNMSDKLASILEAHNKDGTRDLIWGPDLELEPPAEPIEDEVTNKVVLEQAIEKLELTNTSPYAANLQEIKISEDFSREAINELGRIAPYMRYASFPEVPEKQLPPVNSLVAPKTVKAIEQAPVINNGGTITPQVPQAQPVGRQRHTFKARPDKEGRNV